MTVALGSKDQWASTKETVPYPIFRYRGPFKRKVSIVFLFLHKSIYCGYSLEAPRWGASNEYPQCMLSWRNKKVIMSISRLTWSYIYAMGALRRQISLRIRGLIRVFVVRLKKYWVLSFSLSARRRLWSACADAQADLSLRGRTCQKVHFFILRSLHISTHM